VPKEERGQLLEELFEIVTGRVKDFVFKHDSVRTIQCALKYSTMAQRRMIAEELKGNYKNLAESRYAKFLIGKLIVEGWVLYSRCDQTSTTNLSAATTKLEI
jgi:pumilio family protein 6